MALVDAVEALERALLLRLGYADAGIFHAQGHDAVDPADPDVNFSVFRIVLDSIFANVIHHLIKRLLESHHGFMTA